MTEAYVRNALCDRFLKLYEENDVIKISKNRANNTFHEMWTIIVLYNELFEETNVVRNMKDIAFRYLDKAHPNKCNRK